MILAVQAPLSELLAPVGMNSTGVPFILGGTSRLGTSHAVGCCCNGRIVHEPAQRYGPDSGGVVGPFPEGHFEAVYFVALPGICGPLILGGER